MTLTWTVAAMDKARSTNEENAGQKGGELDFLVRRTGRDKAGLGRDSPGQSGTQKNRIPPALGNNTQMVEPRFVL